MKELPATRVGIADRRPAGLGRRARQVAVTATLAAAVPMIATMAASASMTVSHAPMVPPTNCVPNIGVCGYPDAETSGVPGSVTLQDVPGNVSSGPGWHFDPRGFVEVNGNGANLTGLLIPYNVNIAANNVTLNDDKIVVSGNVIAVSLRHTSDVTIENTTISGLTPGSTTLAGGIEDLFGDSTGLDIQSDNIANTSVGVQLNAGTVSGNYIHSEMTGDNGGNIYGIESNGGSSSLTIQDNTVLVGTSNKYAIGLFEDTGAQANRVIDGNILAGGNYVLYGGYNGVTVPTNIQVTNNRFSRYFFANGGRFGPVAHWDAAGSGNTWSGNFWDDTLATIPEP